MSTSTITAPAAVSNDTTSTVTEIADLTSEACDRCGYSKIAIPERQDDHESRRPRIAQSWVRIMLPSGFELTLCKHHADMHVPAALVLHPGVRIDDQTDKINKAPSVSANK